MRTKTEKNSAFTLLPIASCILVALLSSKCAQAAENDIEFNTDVLDVKDRDHVDLSQFSRAGYIMPGDYLFKLHVNKTEITERNISFIAPDDDPRGSEPCITTEIVGLMGLEDRYAEKLKWWHGGNCLDLKSLKGLSISKDLGAGILYINVPQAYLVYTSESWDPPSRWDNGVEGALFDYNVNAMSANQMKGQRQQIVSGNGTSGLNIGPWRIRADWQAQYQHTNNETENTRKNWAWNKFYLYRPLTGLRAKLTLGEDYLSSSIFDSFRFTGASVVTDDNQLPPNLRGYAPEVTGIAKTNAKVTISQKGRVIYESIVAAGPFRIQELSDTVSGELDVKVQEQDGSLHEWKVNTASIPYLTRPGALRYKITSGKPSDYNHNVVGPYFTMGEFSWGVSNGWSLFGGGLLGGKYRSEAIGIGRDLLDFGAISLDITRSSAELNDGVSKYGDSYRLSYSKHFDEYDSQVTFAGYRFSERDFMSMNQYLDARRRGASATGSGKELYTISVNKLFRDIDLSTYLNYSHQTYWDRPANDTWSAAASTYFDMWNVHDISLSLTATRNLYNGKKDDSLYLGLSIPWGEASTINYNGQSDGKEIAHSVGLYSQIDERNSYQISAGKSATGESTGSGYLTHKGDLNELTANVSYKQGGYSALGVAVNGGITATSHGIAMHRQEAIGGTRMMVDTGGVSDIPVRGYGEITYSNIFGKAVIGDVGNYYRSNISVDLNALPDNADAVRSVIQDTLTEGAIGYRKFGILSGQKSMTVIHLKNGGVPPFGATVANNDGVQTGVVGDEGFAWLIGMKPNEIMGVTWNGQVQCHVTMPEKLSIKDTESLFLPCNK